MKFVIVGAGAIGLTLGFLLQRNGKNEVTFYARARRASDLKSNVQKLYSYDEKKLYEFSPDDYGVTSEVSDISIKEADCIIITLPSSALYKDDGKELIKCLSSSGSAGTIFVNLCPGFGLKESVFTPSGIGEDKLVFALPIFLCHNVPMNDQPGRDLHPRRDEAQYAYHMLFFSRAPLLFFKTTYFFHNQSMSRLSKALKKAKLFGVSFSYSLLEPLTAATLMLWLILQAQGYSKNLDTKDESFKLALKAMKQVNRMHGTTGKILTFTMGGLAYKLMNASNVRFSQPIDPVAFNKFHHGSKVIEQNIGLFQKYIEHGKSKNLPTDSIEAFINLYRKRVS
mmetsp:Transcript_12416/g.14473  ORF Transcript_12416/g.14473 Transcript_12416/m.14473 type:complete len:339 (-) Transcript_12416:51-1067(-)